MYLHSFKILHHKKSYLFWTEFCIIGLQFLKFLHLSGLWKVNTAVKRCTSVFCHKMTSLSWTNLILSITSKRHFKTRRAIHSCVPERYYMRWIVIVATWKWECWKWTNKNFTIDIPVVYSVHWHHSVALLLHCQASYKQTNKQNQILLQGWFIL